MLLRDRDNFCCWKKSRMLSSFFDVLLDPLLEVVVVVVVTVVIEKFFALFDLGLANARSSCLPLIADAAT